MSHILRALEQTGKWEEDEEDIAIDSSAIGGMCHSTPVSGIVQLESGAWYSGGVVTRTIPVKHMDTTVWDPLPPPERRRLEQANPNDFAHEPYPTTKKKHSDLQNMNTRSYTSPYLQLGIHRYGIRPSETEDVQGLLKKERRRLKQLQAKTRYPSPDRSKSGRVRRTFKKEDFPTLPPLRMGDVYQSLELSSLEQQQQQQQEVHGPPPPGTAPAGGRRLSRGGEKAEMMRKDSLNNFMAGLSEGRLERRLLEVQAQIRAQEEMQANLEKRERMMSQQQARGESAPGRSRYSLEGPPSLMGYPENQFPPEEGYGSDDPELQSGYNMDHLCLAGSLRMSRQLAAALAVQLEPPVTKETMEMTAAGGGELANTTASFTSKEGGFYTNERRISTSHYPNHYPAPEYRTHSASSPTRSPGRRPHSPSTSAESVIAGSKRVPHHLQVMMALNREAEAAALLAQEALEGEETGDQTHQQDSLPAGETSERSVKSKSESSESGSPKKERSGGGGSGDDNAAANKHGVEKERKEEEEAVKEEPQFGRRSLAIIGIKEAETKEGLEVGVSGQQGGGGGVGGGAEQHWSRSSGEGGNRLGPITSPERHAPVQHVIDLKKPNPFNQYGRWRFYGIVSLEPILPELLSPALLPSEPELPQELQDKLEEEKQKRKSRREEARKANEAKEADQEEEEEEDENPVPEDFNTIENEEANIEALEEILMEETQKKETEAPAIPTPKEKPSVTFARGVTPKGRGRNNL